MFSDLGVGVVLAIAGSITSFLVPLTFRYVLTDLAIWTRPPMEI